MEQLSGTQILLDRVKTALSGRPVELKRMFGGHAFMLNGNMLCCVSARGLMARVGAQAETQALRRPFAARCLGSGREMAGFVIITPEGLERDQDLESWLKLALDHVGGLPPKRRTPRASMRTATATRRKSN